MREARSLVDSGIVEDTSGVRLLVASIIERKINNVKNSIQSVNLQTPRLSDRTQSWGTLAERLAKTSGAGPYNSPYNS